MITIDLNDQESGWLATKDASQLFKHFETSIRLADIIKLHYKCGEKETAADTV